MDDFGDLEGSPKPYKERVNEEYHLQVAVFNHLTGRIKSGKDYIRSTPAFHGLFVCHIYQGRTKEDGFFLKQLGVVSGVADLLLIWKGGFGFIELKRQIRDDRKQGDLSPPQKKFKGFCMATGVRYEVARSVKEAHEIVKGWGLTPAHNSCIEPDIRTKEQKFADAHAFYARDDQ